MNAAPVHVNPFLVTIPWTGHVATDVPLCPPWAREVVDQMTLPRVERHRLGKAIMARYSALVCMCRGGFRADGTVFEPRLGGLVCYRPREADSQPHFDDAFRLLMDRYLELFPLTDGAPPADTRMACKDTTDPNATRPMRRPTSAD